MEDSGNPHPLLEEVLRYFVKALKPQARNLKSLNNLSVI